MAECIMGMRFAATSTSGSMTLFSLPGAQIHLAIRLTASNPQETLWLPGLGLTRHQQPSLTFRHAANFHFALPC